MAARGAAAAAPKPGLATIVPLSRDVNGVLMNRRLLGGKLVQMLPTHYSILVTLNHHAKKGYINTNGVNVA